MKEIYSSADWIKPSAACIYLPVSLTLTFPIAESYNSYVKDRLLDQMDNDYEDYWACQCQHMPLLTHQQ